MWSRQTKVSLAFADYTVHRKIELNSSPFLILLGNGKIELNEFLDMMAAKQKTMEALEGEIKQAFQFFDMDGDGFISMSELKEVAVKLGEDLSEEEIDEMIREADRNGDGQVDFDGRYNTSGDHGHQSYFFFKLLFMRSL